MAACGDGVHRPTLSLTRTLIGPLIPSQPSHPSRSQGVLSPWIASHLLESLTPVEWRAPSLSRQQLALPTLLTIYLLLVTMIDSIFKLRASSISTAHLGTNPGAVPRARGGCNADGFTLPPQALALPAFTPMGKMLDWATPVNVLVGGVLVNGLSLLVVLLLHQPSTLELNIVVMTLSQQLLTTGTITYLPTVLWDPETMVRDIAAYFSASLFMASGLVAAVLPLIGYYGTTGIVMLGGREQYAMDGYFLAIASCIGMCVLAAPLYWIAACWAIRRRRTPQADYDLF